MEAVIVTYGQVRSVVQPQQEPAQQTEFGFLLRLAPIPIFRPHFDILSPCSRDA